MTEDGLLVFDIKGHMAHFRKYYTNSSSLSYAFPPRTTAVGMIAAVLGYERDSYYELFDTARCGIGISVRSGIRHMTQTVNYVRTKAVRELNGSFGPTQVPLDIILPAVNESELVYRVYFWHDDPAVMNELRELIWDERTDYPLYMGISEFIAFSQPVAYVPSSDISEIEPDEEIDLATVCNVESIADGGLAFESPDGQVMQYIKERMPISFGSNRQLKSFGSFLFEKNRRIIRAKLKIPCYRINYDGQYENIMFM
ncbi:CRISPR-associated protein Cas5 [Mahella sp.]|uniref:CRISPR-associated protein Cas5 n=1 Tax=Mahella sp. TaxID=2798721 RepID=UPI0025C6E5FE|nr:CRISPR-associated protein Cas5 [Mahella sp.]MBZ4665031.1 CRISPR-associated protein Cas5 [Mahella sp.]